MSNNTSILVGDIVGMLEERPTSEQQGAVMLETMTITLFKALLIFLVGIDEETIQIGQLRVRLTSTFSS